MRIVYMNYLATIKDLVEHMYQDADLREKARTLVEHVEYPDSMYLTDLPSPFITITKQETPLLQRGGARKNKHDEEAAHQRQTMIGWAQQRVSEISDLNPKVVKLILTADAKTRGAIMNSRSAAQVAHSLAAAAKRHGLQEAATKLEEDIKRLATRKRDDTTSRSASPAPAHARSPTTLPPPMPSSAEPPVQAPPLHHAGQDQTTLLTHMLAQMQHHNAALSELGVACQTMAEAATDKNLMGDTIMKANEDLVAAIVKMEAKIKELDERITMWETTYLASIMEHLKPIPPSPATTEEAPTTQRYEQPSESSIPQRSSGLGEAGNPEPRILGIAQDKSLHASAAKVVKGTAKQPFRSAR